MKNKDKSGLRKFLSSTDFLTFGLFLIAGVILIGGFMIIDRFVSESQREIYLLIITMITIGLLLTCGVFIIIRREIIRPGIASIKGKWAIISAIPMMVLLIIGAIDTLRRLIEYLRR